MGHEGNIIWWRCENKNNKNVPRGKWKPRFSRPRWKGSRVSLRNLFERSSQAFLAASFSVCKVQLPCLLVRTIEGKIMTTARVVHVRNFLACKSENKIKFMQIVGKTVLELSPDDDNNRLNVVKQRRNPTSFAYICILKGCVGDDALCQPVLSLL